MLKTCQETAKITLFCLFLRLHSSREAHEATEATVFYFVLITSVVSECVQSRTTGLRVRSGHVTFTSLTPIFNKNLRFKIF